MFVFQKLIVSLKKSNFKLCHDPKNLIWNPIPCWIKTLVQKETHWKVFNSQSGTSKTFCINTWHVFQVSFQYLIFLSFFVGIIIFKKTTIKTRRHYTGKWFETCFSFNPYFSFIEIFIQKAYHQCLASCKKLDRETDVFEIWIPNLTRTRVVNSMSLCKEDFLSLWCVLKMQTKCAKSQFLQGIIKQNVIVIQNLFLCGKKIESLTRCKSLIQNPKRCENFISKSEKLKKISFPSLIRWKVKFSETVIRSFFGKLPSESFILKMQLKSRKCRLHRQNWIKTWFFTP